MDSWEQAAEKPEKETKVKCERSGCSALNGCLTTILLITLISLAENELKRSRIRLEKDKIKIEYLKNDSVVPCDKDGTVFMHDAVKKDTLKIGSYQRTYVPVIRRYQYGRQKGN